jgi:hypothetical protein
MHSAKKKTAKTGTMKKKDIIVGLIEGIIGVPSIVLRRQPLPQSIIERVKLDLFPNEKHLYIQ